MNVDLLRRLCEAPGIAGREDRVRDVVIEELRPLVDSLSVDVLGNVTGIKRGTGAEPRRRVMLAAHLDEIGFLVRHIDEHGFLRLQPVGGFDARVLIAQRVMVHGYGGQALRGVVQPAAKPVHLLDPADVKPPKLEELFVDLGLPGDEVRAAVEIGDMVTLDRTLEEVGQTIVAKALDDRLGIYVMLEALRAMGPTTVDVLAVATTQEEVGLRGAQTAGYALEPDVAVALDVTLAGDFPGGPPDQTVTRLGQGAALKVMDGSQLTNPRLLRHFRDLAEANEITYQLEVLPRGGTDAGAIQRARAGVTAITLSMPTRYVHTVNEMAHRDDIEACVALLARFLEDAGAREYGYPQP